MESVKHWKYQLGSQVIIECSGEHGIVIARDEYDDSCDCYLIRYKAANGCATECWWDESALIEE